MNMTNAQVEKHNNTLLRFRLETFRLLFEDLNDQQRLELIKSLIWTAPSQHTMYDNVRKLINNGDFQSTID
jgi:hypothetical protein